jgi:hypothetical protein
MDARIVLLLIIINKNHNTKQVVFLHAAKTLF